ncbi:hypothetical protein Pcinc_015995 [Petrolisthes cinctipes]|uniref:Apple domain-containing protein n=1 Tax=Petrolisthes cinctipes TaxID=88211 RepID=A0AAE1FS50_PETCI|nr:hypothetical protein Pcinc_015995 [Petrolisthes cinctipes]
MARSYLPVSLLISLLFLYSALGNPQSIWRRKAVDKKLNNGLLLKSTGSRIMCNAACNILPDCISYNYKDDGMQCELLNTGMMNIGQLTDASGWSYMTQVPPKRPKPGDSCDSPGSVALQYDQPANLRFNDNIPGYACTQHSWVLNQHSQGLTDCHFVLDYDTNLEGLGTSDDWQKYYYYDAFKDCESRGCLGMVCLKGGSDGIPYTCWLKLGSHLSDSRGKKVTVNNADYWYVSCKSP